MRHRSSSQYARVEVHLVDHHGGRNLVGLGHDKQAIDQLRERARDRQLEVTTKTVSMLAAMGRVPRPSGTRRSSSVLRGATSVMLDEATDRIRQQGDTVANHDARCVPLGLAAQDGPDFALGCGHPIGRPIPLEHGAGHARHHASGCLAIASSRAAFTSYSDSALRRSSASVADAAPRQELGLHVPHRRGAGGVPPHEEQRGAEATAFVGVVVHVEPYGIGVAIAPTEGGRAPMLGHVSAEGGFHQLFKASVSRTTLPKMKTMLAGRSASRRMR